MCLQGQKYTKKQTLNKFPSVSSLKGIAISDWCKGSDTLLMSSSQTMWLPAPVNILILNKEII